MNTMTITKAVSKIKKGWEFGIRQTPYPGAANRVEDVKQIIPSSNGYILRTSTNVNLLVDMDYNLLVLKVGK